MLSRARNSGRSFSSRGPRRRKQCRFCGAHGHVEQFCKAHTEYLHALAEALPECEIIFDEADLEGTWELPSLTESDCAGEHEAICCAVCSSAEAFERTAAVAASWETDLERAYLASQTAALREYRERKMGRLCNSIERPCRPSNGTAGCQKSLLSCLPVVITHEIDSISEDIDLDMREAGIVRNSSCSSASEAA